MQSRCAVLRRGTGMVARFLQLVVALTLDEIPATRDRTLVLCPTDHRSRKLCDEQNVSIETTGEQIVRRPRLSTSKSRPPFVNIFPSFFVGKKSTSRQAKKPADIHSDAIDSSSRRLQVSRFNSVKVTISSVTTFHGKPVVLSASELGHSEQDGRE